MRQDVGLFCDCGRWQEIWLAWSESARPEYLTEPVFVGQLVPHMWLPVLHVAMTHVLACQQSKDAGLSCLH